MKLILTGSSLSAVDVAAFIPGLQVVPILEVRPAAIQCARIIADKSGPVVALAKQAILAGRGLLFATNVLDVAIADNDM